MAIDMVRSAMEFRRLTDIGFATSYATELAWLTTGFPDMPQGVPSQIANAPQPEEPSSEAWEATPLTKEQRRNNYFVIPESQRPRVVLRFGDASELLVSGLVDNAGEIAQHPAVIDAPFGNGHIALFSNNPFWRGETQGSYFLVFNAILNFDNLNAGRKIQ